MFSVSRTNFSKVSGSLYLLCFSKIKLIVLIISEQIREHMTPLEALAALVAAVCHDLDHPGVNQPFLIATDNHLAALYKVTITPLRRVLCNEL